MDSILQDSRRKMIFRMASIVLIVISILCLSGIFMHSQFSKSIIISDNGVMKNYKSARNTVGDILKEKNIKLAVNDIVSPAQNVTLSNGAKIIIKRAVPIKLMIAGKQENITTNKNTVGQVLAEQKIVIDNDDKVNVPLSQKIVKDLLLKVVKVREATVTVREDVAFKMNERGTSEVSRGKRRVVKQGKQGEVERTYKVTFEDDNVVNKELINEKVISKPIDGIVEVGAGTGLQQEISRGDGFRYSQVLTMSASAYTAGYESTRKNPGDRGYGRTATGMVAQKGVVAVDPSVIPLGSKLYIETSDGRFVYGYAVAADKGSAIKGNRIDLFYENLSDALGFGRRSVKVYILE